MSSSLIADAIRSLVGGSLLGESLTSAVPHLPLILAVGGLILMLVATFGYTWSLPETDETLRPEQVAARPTSRHDLRGRRMQLHERPPHRPGVRALRVLFALLTAVGMLAGVVGMAEVLSSTVS